MGRLCMPKARARTAVAARGRGGVQGALIAVSQTSPKTPAEILSQPHHKYPPNLTPQRQSLHEGGSGCKLLSSSRLGPVIPTSRALSGRLKFTGRRHEFDKDSLLYRTRSESRKTDDTSTSTSSPKPKPLNAVAIGGRVRVQGALAPRRGHDHHRPPLGLLLQGIAASRTMFKLSLHFESVCVCLICAIFARFWP